MPTETVANKVEDVASVGKDETMLRFIQNYKEFGSLPAATHERMVSLLELERHAAGATIFRFADPGDAMYFLVQGCVRFVTRNNAGSAVVLEEIKEGDVFGEVALYSEGLRSADAEAVTDTILLVLRREQKNEFLRNCPEVSEYLLARMAKRLHSSNRLLRRAQISVEEVVERARSREDRAIKGMVEFFATMPFLVANIVFIVIWLGSEHFLRTKRGINIDTDGLDRLSLVLGVVGLLVSILVLMNQAREAKEESVRDRAEYDATMHADAAINHLHDKVDALAAELRRFHLEQTKPMNSQNKQ